MTKKLYIKTYGCQMNVYDTERMVDVMAPEGYQVTDKPDDADLVVLNTCHIREKAAEKVYSDIGRIRQMKEKHNREGRDMVLAVGGCVAQAEGGEIMKRAPAVDMVFGPQTYHRLPDMVNRAITAKAAGRKPRILDTDLSVDEKFDSLSRKQVERKSSAFLTVQEGCDKFCTYCVVPYTRGAEFSRSVEDVMNDARRLAEAGVVEVTLLGQNVNAYHGLTVSGEEWSLARLIRELAKDPGFRRIRYTTSHPADMSEDLIRVHAEVEECMPYLHLPVQAGSDRILKAMNRHHTAESYRRIIEELRRARPDIALSGDFIVGFPGETDAEFGETMHLVRDIGYAQAYSFKYSARPGTPAAVMDDQVPEDVKAARLAELQAELSRQQVAFNENTVGRVMPVLLERRGKETGQLVGRSPYMQAVHVMAPATLLGEIVELRISEALPNSLSAVLAAPDASGCSMQENGRLAV